MSQAGQQYDYYSDCVRVLMFYEANHATINSFSSTLHYTYPDDFFTLKARLEILRIDSFGILFVRQQVVIVDQFYNNSSVIDRGYSAVIDKRFFIFRFFAILELRIIIPH